ncbi:MAG: hypothetical protein ACW99U_13300 [Candidatus Thorarchaeota archaeon]|jgi:hypothetical protein
MPDWKESDKDKTGFPQNESGEMSIDEKAGYLLEEIHALQERVRSLEGTLHAVIESLRSSKEQ